ncbi:ORF6C domain-containing protein [Peptostreptococcus anaerobius]|uniref:BRO family, N-terminal domain protein n=1 Tax=Peptostreptococcus anaerobius 653-L TaxID=596329 RepID=D3MU46_9FIRM|nr:ORF6C domain-containing protein [Peptostreptococcus anaerobius]EFD04366.1 BRO family, N-terminal domain protein [Peptostreptococcus anaerobius 653-L]
MNNVQVFNNLEFGDVRTAKIGNKHWFMLNDICRVLEIGNSRQARTRLNQDGVITNDVIDSLGRTQQSTFINESNLYKLIFQSRKPQAEKFSDWVTGEVLPTLRKQGTYSMPAMSKELQAILMVDNKTEELREDFQDFKDNAPLFNIECDKLTKAVRKKVIKLIGYKSPAYRDKSLRAKVFSDLQIQIKREFDIDSYKAIKRKDFDIALEIIESYRLPMALENSVHELNIGGGYCELG